MKLSTIGRGLALGACASLVLSACVAGSNAGQSGSSATGDADVTIGLTYIPNVQFAPVYVADAQGLYNDAGVTATVRHHGSDEGLFTALLAGQEDVVIASGDEAVVAASQGLDLVSIGQYYASYPGAVIVPTDSPIATLADLKGKTIGIPGEYGSSYYATLAAIKAGGLQTSDVTISSIGYTQQAALAAGQVDEGAFDHMEVIINSMSKAEREKPELLNGSRRARIAAGAGVSVSDVNQLMKKFNETKKMMKKMMPAVEEMQGGKKGKKGKKGRRRRMGLPGGMGGMNMADLKKLQDMLGE